jgi:hypothetical protein
MKKVILYSYFVLISIAIFSCKKDSSGTHTVKYTIQGSAKSTITYTDQNGNIQMVSNADASWTTGFSSSNHGLVLKLTVVSVDGTTNVGGKIFIDGKQSAQSNGNSSSIAISATLP